MNSISQAGFLGLFAGAFYGGVNHSKDAFTNFMHKNQATAFENHFEAKKQLRDKVTLGFANGAWKWGWRLCLFTTSYTAIVTTISSYRGKSSIIEYLAAGGVTGALYKFNMGLKGMTAGAVFGSILGGGAGLVSLIILKLSGTSMEDVRYWQYKFHTSRRSLEKEIYVDDEDRVKPPLMMDHEERVGIRNLTLDNLDTELKRLESNVNKKPA